MKPLFLFTLICSFFITFSQAKKKQPCDSIQVSLERRVILMELIPYRDSIYLFVKAVDSQIEKSPISRRAELEKLREELIAYRAKINLDIKETSLVSLHGMSSKSLEKMRGSAMILSQEYKKLRERLWVNWNEFIVQ